MVMRTSLMTIECEPKNAEPTMCAIRSALQEQFASLTDTGHVDLGKSNGFLVVFISNVFSGVTFTLRYYQEQKYFSLVGEIFDGGKEFDSSNSIFVKIQDTLAKEMNTKHIERLPIVNRASNIPNYFTKSDNSILAYDFDAVVVHDKSSFQDVKILHSPTLGNCLILDDYVNLAEADIAYTHGLMKFGTNSYKDKEILILGGGDGALLHELLKESPKFVTMIDIDETVIDACRQHLRKACGDALDSFEGARHQIIVDDCFPHLENFVKQNKQFDFIFNDLTDLPVLSDSNDLSKLSSQVSVWDFIEKVLNLSLPLLKPGGKYLNHAIGTCATKELAMYEDILKSLPIKVAFTSHSRYVPSFMEDWAFYEIWEI